MTEVRGRINEQLAVEYLDCCANCRRPVDTWIGRWYPRPEADRVGIVCPECHAEGTPDADPEPVATASADLAYPAWLVTTAQLKAANDATVERHTIGLDEGVVALLGPDDRHVLILVGAKLEHGLAFCIPAISPGADGDDVHVCGGPASGFWLEVRPSDCMDWKAVPVYARSPYSFEADWSQQRLPE